MKVFKFGGASIHNKANVHNVSRIIHQHKDDHLIVVVSAIGKTTNALEQALELKLNGNKAESEAAIKQILDHHKKLIEDLFPERERVDSLYNSISAKTTEVFNSIQGGAFDKNYDQFVSQGEIMSSAIIAAYLESNDLRVKLYDARKLIQTNDTFREAKVDWDVTRSKLIRDVSLSGLPMIHIFQGFIGGSKGGLTTTLGREGSDFSAAILSYCLDAESLTIWKDVKGVLTADPSIFENAEKIDRLSYKEAIEMTYYGAKVIHPKTIKPLQNKSIPMYVKPFGSPNESGTMIFDGIAQEYPPVVVIENDQALMHISSKDFSFIAEDHLSQIFDIFTKYRIKVNMMRNSAISFTVCIGYRKDKMEATVEALSEEFNVVIDEKLELITIRHFSDSIVEEMKKDKMILFEERLRDTIQLVVKDMPRMRRIH
jgi:aspartate kinase